VHWGIFWGFCFERDSVDGETDLCHKFTVAVATFCLRFATMIMYFLSNIVSKCATSCGFMNDPLVLWLLYKIVQSFHAGDFSAIGDFQHIVNLMKYCR